MHGQLKLTIINPEGIIVDSLPVKEVIVPVSREMLSSLEEIKFEPNGFLGIRAGHAPLMVLLQHGEVKYVEENITHTFGLFRGLAEVIDNNVLILASDEAFESQIKREEELQAFFKSKKAINDDDAIDIVEAAARVDRSINVFKNLRKNAKKHAKH